MVGIQTERNMENGLRTRMMREESGVGDMELGRDSMKYEWSLYLKKPCNPKPQILNPKP